MAVKVGLGATRTGQLTSSWAQLSHVFGLRVFSDSRGHWNLNFTYEFQLCIEASDAELGKYLLTS